MNTLQELNDYGDDQVSATDERSFYLVYSYPVADNQTITVNEGSSHNVPVTIDIDEMYSVSTITYQIVFNDSNASVVRYEADGSTIAAVSGWTQSPAGTWTTTSIKTVEDWNTYKSPAIIPPVDSTGFYYTVTLSHALSNGSTGKSWTIIVNVNDAAEITTPTDSDYDEDASGAITGYPQITNVEDTSLVAIYHIEIYPALVAAVDTITSAGTGGTTEWNNTYKKLTIQGTRTQVNSHLSHLTLTPAADYAVDFLLYYELTNPSSVGSSVTQWMRIDLTNSETDNLGNNRTYIANRFNKLFGDRFGEFTGRGNAQLTTAQYKFGVSSASFNADTVDYLNIPYRTDWNLNTTTNFTVEAWVKPTTTAGVIFNQINRGQTGGWALYHGDGDLWWFDQSTTAMTSYATSDGSTANDYLPLDTWSHVAVVRAGTNLKIFVNGLAVYTNSSYTTSGLTGQGSLKVGRGSGSEFTNLTGIGSLTVWDTDDLSYFSGYIDEIRISNTNRYSSTFTPASSQFTTDANTLLLEHMDGLGNKMLQISEVVIGSPTYTFTIQLGASIGVIDVIGGTQAYWTSATNTFSYSGTQSQCNNILNLLYFFPTRATSTSTTLRYRQFRESFLQSDDTVTFTGTSSSWTTLTYTFTKPYVDTGLVNPDGPYRIDAETAYYGLLSATTIGGPSNTTAGTTVTTTNSTALQSHPVPLTVTGYAAQGTRFISGASITRTADYVSTVTFASGAVPFLVGQRVSILTDSAENWDSRMAFWTPPWTGSNTIRYHDYVVTSCNATTAVLQDNIRRSDYPSYSWTDPKSCIIYSSYPTADDSVFYVAEDVKGVFKDC